MLIPLQWLKMLPPTWYRPHVDVFSGTFQAVDHRLLSTVLDQMLCIQAINLFGIHLIEATMSSTNTIWGERMQSIDTPKLSPEIDIYKAVHILKTQLHRNSTGFYEGPTTSAMKSVLAGIDITLVNSRKFCENGIH